MRPPQSQVESIGSTPLDELLCHIKIIQNTRQQTSRETAVKAAPPTGKDIISTLPNEIIYQIAENLEPYELTAFRDSNPREFGTPINNFLRDGLLLRHTSYIIFAMFEAAAKRDVKMIRWLFENERVRGQVLILNQPHLSYPEEKMFRIRHNGITYWYFYLTAEKLDDKTMDAILTAGPNLMMAIKTEETLGNNFPLETVYTFDQFNQILYATAHSALSCALQASDERQVERFIRLGTSTRLATSKTVSEFVYDSCASQPIDWNLGGRWSVIRAEADALFLHTPLEEIDPDHCWLGGNNLLHMAVFCSNPVRMIKFALSKGLWIEGSNLAGEWPLQLAFDNEHVPAKVIRLLIEYGADTSMTPNYLTYGYDPFPFETKHRREKVAVFLGCADIDWVAVDSDGNVYGETLLHVAVAWFMPIKYFKGLLKRGMDVNVRNCWGCTPLDQAWDMLSNNTADRTSHVLGDELGCCASRRGILIEIIEFLMKRGGVESNHEDCVVEDLETSRKSDGSEESGGACG